VPVASSFIDAIPLRERPVPIPSIDAIREVTGDMTTAILERAFCGGDREAYRQAFTEHAVSEMMKAGATKEQVDKFSISDKQLTDMMLSFLSKDEAV
jgi:hypothetical protein